jgi:hypothetical protein
MMRLAVDNYLRAECSRPLFSCVDAVLWPLWSVSLRLDRGQRKMVLYPGGLTISGTDVRSIRAMKSRRRSPLLWHPMPSHCASLDSCGGNTMTLCCPVGCFGRELTYGIAGNAKIDNTTVSFFFQPPLNTIKMKACTRKCLWPRGPGFPNPARSQIQHPRHATPNTPALSQTIVLTFCFFVLFY